jgi:hypothetical protein
MIRKLTKGTLVILVVALFFISMLPVTVSEGNSGTISTQGSSLETTLIAYRYGSQVIEVDNSGTVIWQKTLTNIPYDVERLSNGNTLITIPAGSVIEVDNSGTIVWQKTGLSLPRDAERLANGNTLIAEEGLNRIMEIDSTGTPVWFCLGINSPWDVERLSNGNTLITDRTLNRVFEVHPMGHLVWQKTELGRPTDAERLPNGNTLIADYLNWRVIEVDSSGTIVWQKTGVYKPVDVERLPNGNTLIAEEATNRIIEVDSSGSIVWQITGINMYFDAERIVSTSSAPQVTIDIDPDIINQKSNGLYITCYIELETGYSPADISVNSILLNDVVSAESTPAIVGDYDLDGVPDLMVKFDRAALKGLVCETTDYVEGTKFYDYTITIEGELTDGTLFEGQDTIKVIQK